MKHIQIKALDTGRRVQGFLDAHVGVVGVSPALRQRLDDVVARLSRFRDEQEAGAETARGLTTANANLREALYAGFLRPLRHIANAHLRGMAEYRAFCIPAKGIRVGDLVAKANVAADAAMVHEQFMIDNGMSALFIADFRAAIAAVDNAAQVRAQHVRRAAEATGGLYAKTKGVHDVVRLIDSLVMPLIKKDQQLLSGWKASKRFHQVPVTPQVGGDVELPADENDAGEDSVGENGDDKNVQSAA